MHHILSLCLAISTLTLSSIAAKSDDAKSDFVVAPDVLAGLKQARKIVRRNGDSLWNGYGTAPMGFLLVAQDWEVLLCDRRVPDGFTPIASRAPLKCSQALGPRSWRQPSFLAAMPVFGPPSVVVMGSPQDTGKSLADWTLTIFHEHFHQWQAEIPDYYERVKALDLSAGDETGMWMLNYPFPFGDSGADAAYTKAAAALHDAVTANRASFMEKSAAYLAARRDFAATVSPKDWRYFEFQLWQEGVARWTEIEVGAASGQKDLKLASVTLKNSTLKQLRTNIMSKTGREVVYAFGAAEAMLLQRMNPQWRKCYARQFELGAHYTTVCKA
jgi:hypothetical protein